MKRSFSLILIIGLSGSLFAQSSRNKIQALQAENDSLRLALLECQLASEKAVQRASAGALFPGGPSFTRQELQDKLLPAIKAKSTENHAKALIIIALTDQFIQYCDSLKSILAARTGGLDEQTHQPVGARNKEIPTQILVDEKQATVLRTRIEALRAEYLSAIQNDPIVAPKIVLFVEPISEGSSAKTWEDYKFKNMPLAAVFPILGKYQSDAKTSEAAVLQYFAQ